MAASSAALRDYCAILRGIPAHEASPARSAFAWYPQLVHPKRILSLAATRQQEILAGAARLRVGIGLRRSAPQPIGRAAYHSAGSRSVSGLALPVSMVTRCRHCRYLSCGGRQQQS